MINSPLLKPENLKFVICLAASLLITGMLQAAQPGVQPRNLVIDLGDLSLTAWAWGDEDDELLVALPGSGADNSRYRNVGPLVAEAGYHFVAINQRGIQGSTGNLDNLTLHDYANDIARVIDYFGAPKAHLVGWALGNRIQRMVATDFPDKVASVTLLAAGGLVPATTEPGDLGRLLSESSIPIEEKMTLARATLFADDAPEAMVREFSEQLSYWPVARRSQQLANRSIPREQWWAGGSSPMLIVQGLEDRTAPVGNGRQMQQTYGARITLIEIPNTGHLMAYEKPEETAAAIIDFLARHSI